MRKILLTSTGFDNKNIKNIFLTYVNKPIRKCKVLFIPTAANDKESKEILPFCYKELIDCGISKNNIINYNCDKELTYEDIKFFNVIYVAGGSEKYLIKKINEINFNNTLLTAINKGIFYVGVSAGSMILTSSVKNNIPILSNKLEPHCTKNLISNGVLESNNININLSDNQAVWIYGDKITIIE